MTTVTLATSGQASVRLLLDDNYTINLQPGIDGQQFLIQFQQDPTGGRTVTEGTGVKGTPPINSEANQTTSVEYTFDVHVGKWASTLAQGQQGITALTVSGAIPVKQGLVTLGGGSAQAYTLVAPTAGGPGVGDDGKVLKIVLATAHAHTVTVGTALAINGTDDVITFAGAAGNSVQLQANNGIWWTIANAGGTLSEV